MFSKLRTFGIKFLTYRNGKKEGPGGTIPGIYSKNDAKTEAFGNSERFTEGNHDMFVFCFPHEVQRKAGPFVESYEEDGDTVKLVIRNKKKREEITYRVDEKAYYSNDKKAAEYQKLAKSFVKQLRKK